MTCTCQIDVSDDGDYSKVLFNKIVKARKDHKCCECRGAIKKGQQYRKEKLVFDGDISTYKTCLDYLSIRNTFFCSWFHEQLFDDLKAIVDGTNGNLPESCIAELTPAARDRVCGMIEEVWKDGDE